ncbi:MAG: arginine decarboxylase [Gaiellales bacterium]|nr:arginine decarboxylase [Gaiellales bacterium]
MPSETPLADAVDRFLADPGTTFTVPGHKRNPDFAYGPLAYDMPLVSGAEDSRMSGDVLGRAERLAARLWGGDWCRFSVAGSTHGNQSLALAVARPGESVVVARTLHKSLFAGLVLAGLDPVWVVPDVDPGTGLAGTVPPERVAAALGSNPNARAVFMVEPSYIGMLSDLEGIAAAAHAAGVPLLVDQAWGGHLGFHPDLPASALARGSDALVTSTHKTLTAFTQGSLVVARTDLLDPGRLDEAFEMLHTTSPAAAILASTDRARALMEDRGPELLGVTIRLVAAVRERLRAIAGLHVLEAGDPAKLVLALAGTGADGFTVEADLLAEGIRFEMADRDTLVPIVTLADTEESIDRLAGALERSFAHRSGPPRQPSASAVWSLEPVTVLSPREAYFAPRERVPADRAVGRVAAETAAPYPPGIPALAPGELVTAELLDALRSEAAAGTRVAYCSDPTLETLLVVAAGRDQV